VEALDGLVSYDEAKIIRGVLRGQKRVVRPDATSDVDGDR